MHATVAQTCVATHNHRISRENAEKRKGAALAYLVRDCRAFSVTAEVEAVSSNCHRAICLPVIITRHWLARIGVITYFSFYQSTY